MSIKANIMGTMELIRSFWPDFSITKDDLLSPTSAFVVRFYETFLAELNEKVSYLINDDNYEPSENQEFSREVQLYCKVAKIYTKMNCTTIKLIDLYAPTPKRTQAFVKVALHFLIYINNNLDEFFNVVSDNLKRLTEEQELEVLKQQYLQETADSGIHLARIRNTQKKLQQDMEKVKEAHETMLKVKAANDVIYTEKAMKTDSLKGEVEQLDYEVKVLTDREKYLMQRTVTTEDYEHFQNTEKFLKEEQEQLRDVEANLKDFLGSLMKRTKLCEENLKNSELIGFDALDVNTLTEVRERFESNRSQLEKNKKQLGNQKLKLANKSKEIGVLKQAAEDKKKCLTEKQIEVAASMKKMEEVLAAKQLQFDANVKESQQVEAKIIYKEEKVREIEGDETRLKAAVMKQSKVMLDQYKKTNNKFQHVLSCVKNQR